MPPQQEKAFGVSTRSATQNLLHILMQQFNLSAHAYHRVLTLSRAIADLAGADPIGPAQVAEAVQYRPRERV